MRKGSEKLQAKYGITDLQEGSVQQRCISVRAAAADGYAVHQYFTADTGTDQQAGTILPGKIKMLGPDTRTGNHQVTGAKGTEDTFPGNREPGVDRKFIASGKDDQFPYSTRARQVPETIPALFAIGMMPGKSKEQEHQGKESKKPARSQGKNRENFRAYAEHRQESFQVNSEFRMITAESIGSLQCGQNAFHILDHNDFVIIKGRIIRT